MEESIEQGLNAELNFLLQPGWTQRLERNFDRFRVSLPQGEVEKAAARAELDDEVWRIARFVRYANFASISKSDDGSYTIKSHMASGDGYEILFDPS